MKFFHLFLLLLLSIILLYGISQLIVEPICVKFPIRVILKEITTLIEFYIKKTKMLSVKNSITSKILALCFLYLSQEETRPDGIKDVIVSIG